MVRWSLIFSAWFLFWSNYCPVWYVSNDLKNSQWTPPFRGSSNGATQESENFGRHWWYKWQHLFGLDAELGKRDTLECCLFLTVCFRITLPFNSPPYLGSLGSELFRVIIEETEKEGGQNAFHPGSMGYDITTNLFS